MSSWPMPLRRQIRSNSTSAGRGLPNLPVNCLPLSVKHFVGDAVSPHRGDERPADRPCGATADDGGDHAEPGVVIDPGDQLQLGAVGQEHRPGDVQLPQLHRCLALPALVILTSALALARRDQATADQHPVDSRPRRHRRHARLRQLILQPLRSPARVRAAELADQCLHISADLAGLEMRPVGMVRQARLTPPSGTCQARRERPDGSRHTGLRPRSPAPRIRLP